MRGTSLATFVLPLVIGLVATACDDKSGGGGKDSTPAADTYVPPVDADGDGVTEGDGDCDDGNADIYPGRAESCDGLDNNCNGLTDEGFDDTDGDDTPDCLDTEDCDGIDNDGDGEVDEDFSDSDGDGNADCVSSEDCDGIDNDGDGNIDEGYDADGDGYTQCGSEDEAADCDDTDASISPGASESAGDLVDNDCDGLIDEGSWAEGDLVIVEIMNNPDQVLDPHGEWFEIYNASDRDLVLNGLTISSSIDGDSHQIESDSVITLSPGDQYVLGLDDDPITNGGATVDYVYTGVVLSNESDEIILTADGIVIDEVEWDDGDTFPDPTGASMSLDPWYYSDTVNDVPTYWCVSTEQWAETSDKGSPGEENELCSTFDHDGDGYSGDDGDCDDADDSVYPGAPELDSSKDNDCDGEVETMPVASASYDAALSTLYHCDTLYLDGSGSSDAEGSALTYTWELTSAPSSSARTTSDIIDTTDMSPVFGPDVPGTYTFTLTVNDGGADSYPDTLSVTITSRTTNTDPSANAGSDQEADVEATCTAISYGTAYSCPDCDDYEFSLDGSSSSDADCDSIEAYSWSITSGTSYGSITDEDTATPTVTVSGVSATYGTTTSQTVTATLTVTDCYGGTGSDSVDLTVNCEGT